MRIVVAIVVWVVAAVCAVAIASVVSGSIHTGTSASPTSMTSTDPGSMFRTKNFTKALDVIRGHVGPNAELDNFVVYPGYVSVTGVTQTGESDITYYADGRYIQDDSGGSAMPDSIFSLAEIKPGIPQLFSARIARLGHMPLSQLHYLVAMKDPLGSKKLVWMAYPVEGTSVEYWQAAGGTGQLLVEKKNASSGPQPLSG